MLERHDSSGISGDDFEGLCSRIETRSLTPDCSTGNRGERGRPERLLRKDQHYPGSDWLQESRNEAEAVGWVTGGCFTVNKGQGVSLRKVWDWRQGKGWI